MKNKDSKCQYLIIDAKNVVNYPIDVLHRKFVSYNKCDKPFIDLNEVFEKYDIPEEYRLFVVRINQFISRYECQEYLTEIPFDYTGYTRFKKNTPKIIRGRAITNNPNNIIEFETPMVFKNFHDITNFYVSLTNDGLFDRYKMALLEIFSLSFSYDNLNAIKKYRHINKNNS